ncbi:MAG: DUF4856 domain-containing protein [Myxococcales bacterium]|nr:DUF4856 domain-containing protein [Myxococcales bacterium]
MKPTPYSALLFSVSLLACDEGQHEMTEPPPACELSALPDSYQSDSYDQNTVVEREVRTRFKAMLQPLKDAEASLSVKPSQTELMALWNAGNPSLRSLTSSYYAPRVETLFAAFEKAAGNNWTPTAIPSGTGGKFGSYIFSAQGVDLRQGIEKGMFAAALYNHALSLLSQPVSVATLDRLIAIFGAHASFPADTAAMQHPDEFVAAYAKRRDKRDPLNPGPYLKIKQAMIRAQAALQKGSACTGEVSASLQVFRTEWERATFQTVIYYLNDASKKLSAAAPTAADQSAALHALGEAVGFVHGWRQLPSDRRIITDAQVDELLRLLLSDPGTESTAYKFITSSVDELPKLTLTIQKIATIYGLTAAQVEDSKINY